MKQLTQLLTILVGIGLIGSTASAQLTVTGGDLEIPGNHIKVGGDSSTPNLKIYNDGEMAWNSPGQVDWTLRPNGANMFRIGTSGSPAGANTFVINSVGQVGFGGTPSTQFDVQGPMRLYGSLGGAEMVFDPQTAPAWTIRGGEAGLFRIGSTESGANLLVLNNDGNIGIGTTNPQAKLHVEGQVKIAGGSPGAGKVLTSDASGLASWEEAAGGGGGDDGDWVVNGNEIYTALPGNVGIGTSSPGRPLHLFRHSQVTLKLESGTTSPNGFLIQRAGVDTWIGNEHPSGHIYFYTANGATGRTMVFEDTGNLGIGTTEPAEKLDVAGTVTAESYAGNTGPVILETSGAERMRINPNGYVGIGTPDPTREFHLHKGGSTVTFKMTTVAANSDGFMIQRDGTDTWMGSQSASGNIYLFTKNGATASTMVLEDTGNVGIGTTAPGAKLEVAGQLKITGGTPGAGKVLTSDGDGLASWETASAGAQGPAGPAGPQGAQGKQGSPGQDASSDCVECAELQQITFDAVCKIFDGSITNSSEINECVSVIAQLAVVGVDVCSPNETDCLSVILGNVQDLIDSK
jgi:hypothetical protein